MAKDIGLAVEAAKAIGAQIVLGNTALESYQSASANPKYRDRDSRIVYKWLGGIEPSTEGRM